MKKFVPFYVIIVIAAFSIATVGKGKPSNDIPLRVTVSGMANNPGGFAIVSDGRDYVDGEEGVQAIIDGSINRFVLDPTLTAAPAPRALWFDFSNKIANGTEANPFFGLGMKQIDSQISFDEVGTVPVGATEERVGRIGEIFAGNGRRQAMYRVVFNNDPNGLFYSTVNYPNLTSPLIVSHPDCNTWNITPKVVSYNAGAGSGPVAAFVHFTDPAVSTGQYLMPFQITLKRKVSITCP